MEILRCDLENKERLEQLVKMKLAHMGVYEDSSINDDLRFRTAVKEYFMEMVQEYLENSEDNVLTKYFDDSELALWGFLAGYRKALLRS